MLRLILFLTIVLVNPLQAKPVEHRFTIPWGEMESSWAMGYGVHDEDSYVEVYIPSGEQLREAREVIGSQGFDGDMSPDAYFEEMLKELNAEFAQDNLQYRIIEQDEQGMIVEWWNDRGIHEVFRMTRTDAGQRLILYYQTSKGRMGEEGLENVLRLLRSATITEAPKES